MSLYTISLFLHVSGAIGACVSISIWLFGLAALRRAQRVEQVRAVAWLIIIVSPLIRVSGIEPLLLIREWAFFQLAQVEQDSTMLRQPLPK